MNQDLQNPQENTVKNTTYQDIERIYKIISVILALFAILFVFVGISICTDADYTYEDTRGNIHHETNGWIIFYGILTMATGIGLCVVLGLAAKIICGAFYDLKNIRFLLQKQFTRKTEQTISQPRQYAYAQPTQPTQPVPQSGQYYGPYAPPQAAPPRFEQPQYGAPPTQQASPQCTNMGQAKADSSKTEFYTQDTKASTVSETTKSEP